MATAETTPNTPIYALTPQQRIAVFRAAVAALTVQYGVTVGIVTNGGNFELDVPGLAYLLVDGWQPPQDAEQPMTASG